MWTREEFEARLRALLEERYHHRHPFHQKMHEGRLSPRQLRGWIANRFYYQEQIPVKDALLLAKMPREYRRLWIRRIIDHDGARPGEGGIEAWLRLGEAAGLEREELVRHVHLVPGARFAVDAYVNFVRDHSWVEGVAASLTELVAPHLHTLRLDRLPRHYPWVRPEGLEYFRTRIQQAARDAQEALEIVFAHSPTLEAQQRALRAVEVKCELLWAFLDAVSLAYPDG